MVPLNETAAPSNALISIKGCAEYTMNMAQYVNDVPDAIKPALEDAALPYKSDIFNALFKDASSSTKTFVHKILASIASGTGILDLKPNPQIPTAPTIVCVSPLTIKVYDIPGTDLWDLCTAKPAGPAFYLLGYAYIFICPSFWTMPPVPTFPDCPSIRRNQFAGPGRYLAGYASYLIIHEMVHFYLQGASLLSHTDPPEVYPINDCVALDAYNSRRNPQNYQHYVACMALCVSWMHVDEVDDK